MIINSADYDIDTTGRTLVTEKLQELIDLAARSCGTLKLGKGTYLTAPLFLRSNMNLVMDTDTVLLGTTDESVIGCIDTRVAGIEMEWYPGVLNINNASHVTVSGGKIDGQGEYWWKKYWGSDCKGGMRKEYDEKGLRWACDYDCMRVRNLLVYDSTDVSISNLTSVNSGFWNVHICYCSDVKLSGIHIISGSSNSPSTDGIDIDSSCNVVIEKCVTDCNDDSICIKSGRDQDGVRVGKPSKDILINDCTINKGFGITIGSEVSGGIENITIRDIHFNGTDCGFRIKSSRVRQGYIKNVDFSNITMVNVKYPVHICLDWNKTYCQCELPQGYSGGIPDHWEKLLQRPAEEKLTIVEGINISHLNADYTHECEYVTRAFNIEGYVNQPVRGITLQDVAIRSHEYGRVSCVEHLVMNNVVIDAAGEHCSDNDEYDNR